MCCVVMACHCVVVVCVVWCCCVVLLCCCCVHVIMPSILSAGHVYFLKVVILQNLSGGQYKH